MLVNLRPHFSPLHRAQHQKKIKQIFKQKKKKKKATDVSWYSCLFFILQKAFRVFE